MFDYQIFKCKWCGTDLKFSAPCKKNENWFCGSFCEISKTLNDLSSIKEDSVQIAYKNIWTNLHIQDGLERISCEDSFNK
mgnify:FL=1